MLFSTSSTASRSKAFIPFLFLAALLTLVHTTAALPAARSTKFEPLFRPASPQVGPTRSIERLRLRRALNGMFRRGEVPTPVMDKRAGDAVRNPKVKRAAVAGAANPKAKRAATNKLSTRALERRQLGLPPIVPNPKTKRSAIPVPSSPSNLRRRSAGLPAIVSNPKKRSLDMKKRAVVEATISVTPSTTDRVKRSVLDAVKRFINGSPVEQRDLVRRRNETFSSGSTRIGTVRAVPNPKSPTFMSDDGSSSASSSAAASSSFVSAPYSSNTIPFSTISTSTASAVPTGTTCSVTADCSNTPPANANKYCNSGVCSFRCRTGYTLSGSTCVAASSATTSAAATSATTSRTSTSTSASASATSTGWPSHGGPVAGGYYPDWVEDVMPPEALDMSKFDLIHFSFAIPNSNYKVTLDSWSGNILKRVVQYAHGNNTKVTIAVGGWSSSQYFSGAVATASRRTAFVQSIVDIVNTYNLDGVDVDWEYPGTQGASGNQISSSDTANLLTTLQLLRAALPTAHLSTCTTHQTYIGASGSPIGDVSAFADVLDNVLVMNYDVWGASSTPGPNAPLSNKCSGSLQPNANMASAISQWTAAGMPASKILMGVPAYGYISSSTATSLIHKRDDVPTTGLSNRHLANIVHEERNWSAGHRWYIEGQRQAAARRRARRAAKRELRKQQTEQLAKRGSIIVCPNNHSGKPCEGVTGQNISEINWNPLQSNGSSGPITGPDGVFNPGAGPGKVGKGDLSGLEGNQIQFVDLINYGVIIKNSAGDWVGTNGYTRAWDDCSSTPYLYDTSRKVVITYDDPESLALKGELAAKDSIGGILMWDLSGDTKDFQLTQSYRTGMGLSS
ncbi:hypothetical protein JCM6882_008275 [Rhodosporidiobolus microsporus]